MRKTKFCFSSPIANGDTPVPRVSSRDGRGVPAENMDKSLDEVKRAPSNAQELKVSLAATSDLASAEAVRDLQSKSRNDPVDTDKVGTVHFVADGGPTWHLPVFVTRTTLAALLADE
ncbi:hypothetical protein [Pseudoduganella flava]|uniref:Uncharacterized protein n=1 Tax=Pseudoduganella flava TaxID=871742 RepID=A0ABX6FUH4_9BURK|nr:hypothetical protein [Pseudoduganella flava]QGZ40549.1 hypothetical protein GO485_16785 [Pseudoduganella flava]